MCHDLFFRFQSHSSEAVSSIIDRSSRFGKTQVLLCRDNTDSVGVSLSSAPALNTDDHISFVQDAQING